jgi:cardiolipin synthase
VATLPIHARNVPVLLAAAALTGVGIGVLVSRNILHTKSYIRELAEGDYAVGEAAFEQSVNQLLGPPLLGGNSVRLLKNGVRIFPAMLEAIRSAEKSITFENFVWKEGKIARSFADALAERGRAGVRVHFIQDAIGCDDLLGSSLQVLRNSPVELEIFRFLNLTRLNQRTHRKILVVDGRIGFTGGVGIADEWDGDADSPGLWRDDHYRLEGPAVAQMQQAFMDNWMKTRATILHGESYFPEIPKCGNLRCQVFKSSASEGAASARVMVLLALAAARRSIRIANPYFIADKLILSTILKACRRGVRVELVTAGPNIDQPLVRAVGRERWKPLLESGMRFYEFQDALFHCKYLIVDDLWVSVGSANFDNRSLRINEEANLNVLDAEFAREHVHLFEQDRNRSRLISTREWKRRPISERMMGQAGQILRSQL